MEDNLCEKCGYYGPEEDPICNWISCDGLECDECNFTPQQHVRTLDEAIDSYMKKAKEQQEELSYTPYELLMDKAGREKREEELKWLEAEYVQLAYWLKELRYDREYIKRLDETLEEIRANFKREEINHDYFTGFISCLSNIEGTIACIKKELKDESICK